MRRRVYQIILPIIIAVTVVGLIFFGAVTAVTGSYRARSNQDLARVIGVALDEYPDLDAADLLHRLRQPGDHGSDAETRGMEILRQYGLTVEDYATPATQLFVRQMLVLVLAMFGLLALILCSYFCLLDYRRQRKINQLVTYLQALSRRVYDLRLDENTEDELSLLTNELYKITVALKEAAEQNRLGRQNLETALADISHQLRTPLTSLQVVIDNIYDDPKMPLPIRQDFLRSAGHQVTAMSELVTTLLNLAKFDNGSITLHSQPVKVAEIFHQIQQNLEVLADLQNVQLKTGGDLAAKVQLDLRWQVEALTNITKNCLEHSAPGSKVTLHAENCPLFLKITITDTGEGIAATDLHHIFERFYKAQNASATSMGIGLAFAKTIIEASGGQIAVSSQLGKGTRFTVTYFK